jgi:hypothetical protein
VVHPLVQISFHSCLSRASTASGSFSGSYAPAYALVHRAVPSTPYATPLPAPAAAAASSSASSSLSPFLPRLPLHLLASSATFPDTPPVPAQSPSDNEEQRAEIEEELQEEEEAVARPDAASPSYPSCWSVENQPAEAIVTAARPPQFPSLLNMEPELAAELEPLFLRMLRIIWVRPALSLPTLASTAPRARTHLGSWRLKGLGWRLSARRLFVPSEFRCSTPSVLSILLSLHTHLPDE